MAFGIIGRAGPGMRQVVGFGDRFTGRGTFGDGFGATHCNSNGDLLSQRRGPLSKLLWADLLTVCDTSKTAEILNDAIQT